MTKDELKRMKRKLETKLYIEDAYSGQGPISQFEIEQRVDTLGAIENIEKYFENVITYFSLRGVKYDEITLKPFFSLVVKEKDLDENTIIKKDIKPIQIIVAVRINGFYCMNKEQKLVEDPDVIYLDNSREYIVNFDEFINLLEQKGFSYNGLTSIEEIQAHIISGHPTISDITLSFNKKLNKIKI